MKFSRWLLLIAAMVGVGLVQVAWHNAIYFTGYAIGDRLHRVQTIEREVAWLDTQVTGLGSPVRLADVAQQRQLTLVAWSMIPTLPAAPAARGTGSEEPEHTTGLTTPAASSLDEHTAD